MSPGTIVLTPFPFTDLSGSKLRPALILAEGHLDIVVSFITTQVQWREPTDISISPSPSNGIKKPSLIKLNKIATIHKSLVIGKMGDISQQQFTELHKKLKIVFQIP